MEKQHQRLGVISRDDTVKLDAISSDILVFTKRCILHAVRWGEPLRWTFKEAHRM